MTTNAPAPIVTEPGIHSAPGVRPRDADSTREALLASARSRFARDGYADTTVRDIAMDAGVNVALINRYFVSKEGLFEACLQRVVKDLRTSDEAASTVDQMLKVIVSHIIALPGAAPADHLLLLLRTSGDDGADRIRRNTLYDFSARMAAAAGWDGEEATRDAVILRAQLVLSTALGIVMLSHSTALEPLASASASDLEGPLGDVIRVLLTQGTAAG